MFQVSLWCKGVSLSLYDSASTVNDIRGIFSDSFLPVLYFYILPLNANNDFCDFVRGTLGLTCSVYDLCGILWSKENSSVEVTEVFYGRIY